MLYNYTQTAHDGFLKADSVIYLYYTLINIRIMYNILYIVYNICYLFIGSWVNHWFIFSYFLTQYIQNWRNKKISKLSIAPPEWYLFIVEKALK